MINTVNQIHITKQNHKSPFKHFLILLAIFSIQAIVSIIMANKYSIDYVAWPVLMILFSMINVIISGIYIFIVKLTRANLTYTYTCVFGVSLSIIGIIGNFLYYFKYFHVSDEVFYKTYAIFLLVHLAICLGLPFKRKI